MTTITEADVEEAASQGHPQIHHLIDDAVEFRS